MERVRKGKKAGTGDGNTRTKTKTEGASLSAAVHLPRLRFSQAAYARHGSRGNARIGGDCVPQPGRVRGCERGKQR